jgi:hypothetical protein
MPTIRGTVLNSNSHKPIAKALVYTDSSARPNWDTKDTASDINGLYEIKDVPPGVYTLRVQTEPIAIDRFRYSFFGEVDGLKILEEDVACDIQVNVRGILHGHVRDVATGKPIRGAVVQFSEETGGLFRSVSEADGLFSLGHINPQAYNIFCESMGYEKFQQKIFVGDALEDGPVVLPIFLIPLPASLIGSKAVVRGFVFNEMGNPAVNATVTLIGDQERKSMVTFKNYFDYQTGNYEFYDVPEGKYVISVTKPGMQPARTQIQVTAGKEQWAPDLRLTALPVTAPPEIEYLTIEPRTLAPGQQLQIRVRFKGELRKVATASGTIQGSGGLSIGFTMERGQTEGELVRTFDWTQPGLFVLSQLMVFNTDTGKGFELPVQAQFEVLPRQTPPLNPESAIFRVNK